MHKKVSLKITETSPTGTQKRCLMKMFPDTKVETIRKQYMTLRDISAAVAGDIVFTLDGKGLHDTCSLAENSLTKFGYTYTIELKLKKDVKEFVEKKELPKEVPRMESSMSNINLQNVEMSSGNLLSQKSSSASVSTGIINAQSLANLPSSSSSSSSLSQQATTSVKFKLKIQEKVEGQIISCDIEANSTMLLEKVTAMYCKHRKYNVADYVFAYNGAILDVKKSLIALGVGKSDEAGKTFLINCFHKDKVTVK